MSHESDSEDEGYKCMELPTLIRQLTSVLDQYPDDGQILKELIQNAEDADATEMRILYDARVIQPDVDPRLRKKRQYLASLQAPALCVYNNALFTEEDWCGITMLHNSIKENEPLKVGRFGLGFKSVFHVTDFPCVISGDSVLFINPHVRNMDRVCYLKKLCSLPPETKQILLQILRGTFGFTDDVMERGFYEGTILWFPLRKRASALSDNCYNEEKVMDLFRAFKAEASITLIFLKSMEKIQLYQRLPNGTLNLDFTVQLSPACLELVRKKKKSFISEVKQLNGGIPPASIESQLNLTVEIQERYNNAQEWIVINFYKGGRMSEKFRQLCSDPSLSYSPYVGLAVPVGQQCEGHVFCFLPLPLQSHSPTGLQVHVNGFFALSQNRRHVKWPTADQLQNQSHTDKAIEWNQCLVGEVLPEVYCNILKYIIQYSREQANSDKTKHQVYRMIPAVAEVDVNWRRVLSLLYDQLYHSIPFLFAPVNNGIWIKLQEGVLVDETSELQSLIVEIFTLYNRNIVPVPSTLLKTLQIQFREPVNIVTAKSICETLRSDDRYTLLPRQKKLTLVQHLLGSDQYVLLKDLYLLPVADGNFAQFGKCDVVACDSQAEVELFPGLDHQFTQTGLPWNLHELLKRRASDGVLGLSLMTPAIFPELLRKCLLFHFPGGKAELPSQYLNLKWLKQVWTYINGHGINVQTRLRELKILPDVDSSGRGKLHSFDDVFIAQSVTNMESLPQNVGTALQKLDIVHLKHVPDFVLQNPHVIGKVIQYPTQAGVIRVFEKLSEHAGLDTAVQIFNCRAEQQERKALVDYMSHCQMSNTTIVVLRKLAIFTDTDGSDCSVESQLTLAPDEKIPVPYPEQYMQCSSHSVKKLALKLGVPQGSFFNVCQQILKQMHRKSYADSQITDFIEFLMKSHQQIIEKTKQVVSQIGYLASTNGRVGLRAGDLFSPDNDFLRKLFLMEDKFPAQRHTRTDTLKKGLMIIGLKTEENVTEDDIVTSARKIEELIHTGNSSEAEVKASALTKCLEKNLNRYSEKWLSKLKVRKCIPCLQQKPDRYPPSLAWKGKSSGSLLCSEDVYSSKYSPVIGSVCPVANTMHERVEHILGMSRHPEPHHVIQHLKNMGSVYTSREHHHYMDLLQNVYSFLQSQRLSGTDQEMLACTRCVWVGVEDGFQYPKSVYVPNSSDLDLKPYRYPLPSLLSEWSSLLKSCGCHPSQTPHMLTGVLEEIKEKHDGFKTLNTKRPVDVRNDLKLILQILNELKKFKPRPDGVYFPVHQKNDEFLVLLPAEQCTYCNADWLKDQASDDAEDDADEIWFVHSNISETTAQQLGVCSLTERVMDDTDDFDMEYHQSEPLTRRLKNLLREYTDGFSVPKELIQNADDAGATEVCFMYDERQNQDARTSLMNENMAALQGPAFWAFNNSSFKESDFNNIKKLSGATKEEDTTKVGKFGLGFNSVYNLTDVPSFISLNNMVIFDPQEKHLGKPGLRANLKSVKNSKMLRKMSGQFKPFEGIFGCRFRTQAPNVPICDGTLFRFPLRTQAQASESEIKDLSYSAYEMGEFFKKFAESSGNLLLFTQNVSCVKFYHLPPNGNPDHPELLLHVEKTTENQTILYPVGSSLTGHSVLSYAAEKWKNQPSEGLKIKERTDIHLQIFSTSMTRKFKLVSGVNTIPWLIVWVTGQGESESFARSGKLKGLLPLAAVALPLREEDGRNGVYEMNKCPTGFYKEGHYFCFLPLPVHVPFPVHINATFALTSDRRQLCTRTEDDKELYEAVWNQVLKQDAVCRSYISALVEMPVDFQSDISSFYQLWPDTCQTEDPMVKSFYQVVALEDAQVFLFSHDATVKRTSLQRIKFLNQKLHADAVVGNIAFKAAVHFWNNSDKDIVDIPSRILESFKAADLSKELELRCMSTLEFFSTVFFPNIYDAYWTTEDRDKLTRYALNLQDSDINHLIKETECVPVRPHGVLKQPRQLVHPHGKCAAMFMDEDECFPTGTSLQGFTEPLLLEILCKLGMVRDDLPGESLLQRAQSVAYLHQRQPQEAVKRCWKIVDYISGTEYSSRQLVKKQRIAEYTEEVIQQLKEIPFLPILQRPASWQLSWKADEIPHQVFAKAHEMFSSNVRELVGCSKLVIDSSYSGYIRDKDDVLTLIGLHHRDEIDIDTAARQLLCVAEKVNCTTNPSLLKPLSDMCLEIYKYLKCCCEETESDDIEHRTTTLEMLRRECVILVGERMVPPHQVAFQLSQILSPHLYQVNTSHAKLFRQLFEVLGVKDRFDIQDFLHVVQCISDNTALEKLTDENLSCIERLMIALIDIVPDQYDRSEIPEIMLPDRRGFLYKASSLCLDDCDWVGEDDTMTFLHPKIHPVAAKRLGVKGKREADLCDHISSIESFGQSEKLTSRIRRILSGYPCDVSIMKELLQNADDAGATVLMFIKDFRSLPTKQVFGETWSSLQGPALCVYNDSFFTDEDFAGIKNLGQGSKGDDPLKTGQYGVGFNAVYHLTDVPSFMTIGPTTNKTICALDPHVKYVPWATSKNPGVKIQDLDKLRVKYKDAFEGYLEACVPLQEKGTLFRFPLRTEAMAEDSVISNKEITTDMITDLLEEFKKDMFDSLLFLHNVRKIVIASISADGELSTEYYLESKMTEDAEEQKKFMKELRSQAVAKRSLSALTPLELKLTLEVHDSREKKQKWLVVHRSGFTSDKDIPISVSSAWERGDIGLLPRGGVAVPIPPRSEHSGSGIKGKAFCILPLPVLTGLPVHVNGQFALDHEARRNLWHGSQDTQDYRSDWNKHIVEAIVIPAYLSAMEAMKTKMNCTQDFQVKVLQQNLKGYYQFLPDISKATDSFWKSMAMCFYTDIVQKQSCLFGVIKPVQGKFSDHPEGRTCDIIASVRWVSVTSDVGFPGYFNDLASYYHVEQPHSFGQSLKKYDAALARARRNTQQLSEVLRDLNMKVISAPFQVYSQFQAAELSDKVSCVTPTKTLQFLKSFADESPDQCTLGTLQRSVEETLYKSVATLKLLSGFIAQADSFASEIQGLPLAMTISRKVAVFSSSEPLIVTSFTDLLTSIPDVALHPEIAGFYMKHITQSSSLMAMQIGTFASLLPRILDHQTFACRSLIPWEQNPDFPSRCWIAHLWQYLNTEINEISEKNKTVRWLRNMLEPLSTWCLLPARRDALNFVLCSIKDSSKIIDLDSVMTEKTCARALEKMKILHFSQTMLNCGKFFQVVELVPKLVANWEKPDAVLFALSGVNFSEVESVSETEAQSFSSYFCKNLDCLKLSQDFPNPVAGLRSLPFYPTVTSRMVPVAGDVYAVKSSYKLLKAGLDHWSAETGKTLLKYSETLRTLIEYLGVQTLTLTEVYSMLLIPSFRHFSQSAKPDHLKFIKESLLRKSDNYNSEQRQLIEQLKMLPFIETSDGRFCRAEEFYSRKETVFVTMCPDSAFLPDPYNKDEWHNFLVLIGLQACVTVDHFVTFARQVEKLGQGGISKDVAKKSEILMSHLCSRRSKVQEGILGHVKAIKFLLPYVVSKEHEDGAMLTEIHLQFQAAKSLVCFSESLGPQHCYCVWTSCTMFRTEYDPSESEYGDKKKSVLTQLGIPDSPPEKKVVQHVLNICTSMTKMQKKKTIQSISVASLKKVMKAVYEYLQDNGISEITKEKLSATCTICLPEKRIFVAADEVVTGLSPDEVIDGYVYKGPLSFGEFFPVFEALGAAETASAKTYARALQKLQGQVGNKELHPNELHVVKTAVILLFKHLRNKTGKSIDLCSLFLPNCDNIMTLSTRLVISDNKLLRERVKKLKLNFFVGFRELKIEEINPLKTISLLPPEHRPTILSKVMKERLTDTCIGSACKGSITNILQNVIQTPEFISGLVRLVNHVKILKELRPPERADCETIEQNLSNIELFEVEHLKTLIIYDGNIVEGSESTGTCVTVKEQQPLCIYISTNAMTTDEDSVYEHLSSAINQLIGNPLGSSVATLMRLLKCEPAKIHEILDNLKIAAFDYSSSRVWRSVFPPPGTIVPEKFHFMLDNSFCYFKEGEYAGYEVYDPLIDDEGDDSSRETEAGDVFIVYVIIKKVVTLGETPLQARYIIEAKDGITVEVCATHLYKFFRDTEDGTIERSNASPETPLEVPQALEDVLREIRNTLKEAWAMLGEKDRNRVKKRLYFKWHPDKNPDRIEFCNEVCKYIALYIERLEKGLSIDDIDDKTDGGSSTDYAWFHQFNARTSRHRSYQKEYKDSRQNFRGSSYGYGSGYGSGSGSYHQSAGNPDLREARRWLCQAKADLDAAREALGFSRAYNWICFMAQQAAEKAIKSMLYNKDSRIADETRTHDLPNLSRRVGNSSLTLLASQLQNVIQDFNRLRYPDRLAYPRIPADVYTQADASLAFELADKIVCLVEPAIR